MINSIENMKVLMSEIKRNFETKTENIKPLMELRTILESYLESPETAFPDIKTKSCFFSELATNVLQLLIKQTSFTNSKYKEVVCALIDLFLKILLKELPKDNREFMQNTRGLLDIESPIYKEALRDIGSSLTYTPPVSPTWISDLKKGSKIDVVREEKIIMDRVEGWVVAIVKDITGDTLHCEYDNCSNNEQHAGHSSHTVTYSKSKSKIAPYDSRTRGWEWRTKLKPDDRVDIFDTQGHWFLGTIMKLRIDKEGNKEARVAFRVYAEDGTKRDEHGRKHEGWSETYDEWIPINSVRLQKPNSITKFGTVYCKRDLDNESPAPDDSGDVLINYPVEGDQLPLMQRPGKIMSVFYFKVLMNFANAGGFKTILQCAKSKMEEKSALSVDMLFTYLDLMSAPHDLYHRSYVVQVIHPFMEIFMKYMSAIPDEQLRDAKKEKLDSALAQLDSLMRRVYTAKTKGEQFIKLKVGIAVSLLRADILERRIHAIRLIAETCKNAKYSHIAAYYSTLPTANDNAVLIGLLQVPLVIEEIFGKRSHIQLIQRSTEILSFFLLNGHISNKEFNVIWDCCEHDEQSKVEILKVISDSSALLPSDLIGFVIEKYAALPKARFKDQDVALLYELCGKKTKATLTVLNKILEIMWEVIVGIIPEISTSLYLKVMERFCDIITTPAFISEAEMREYFEKVYIMLKEDDKSALALRILNKCLVQLPVGAQYKSKMDMVSIFLKEGYVIPNLFSDFERYHAKAKANKAVKTFKFSEHKDELNERTDFLLFALKYSNYKISLGELIILWKLLIQESIVMEDQTIFYKFLKEVLSLGLIEKYVTSLQDMSKFFVEVICSEKNNFQLLSLEGMQAIESLLVSVNKSMGNIKDSTKVKQQKQRQIGPEPQDNRSTFVNYEGRGFVSNVAPANIKGINVLWKIVLESKCEAVTNQAIELLNDLYTKLGEELEDIIGDISLQFVETAIEKLNVFYEHMTKDKENRSHEIVKLLRLVEEMLGESERKGNMRITPLLGIFKGLPIKIIVLNHAVDVQLHTLYPEKIIIQLHSAITFWQMKVLIANKLNIFPESVNDIQYFE